MKIATAISKELLVAPRGSCPGAHQGSHGPGRAKMPARPARASISTHAGRVVMGVVVEAGRLVLTTSFGTLKTSDFGPRSI